jgi:hypothetical protein
VARNHKEQLEEQHTRVIDLLRRVNTEGTECARQAPEEARLVTEEALGWLNWILEITGLRYRQIAPKELEFIEIASRDAALWREIKTHAGTFSNEAQRLERAAGRFQDQANPWSGPAGDSYRSHLPDQRAAGQRTSAIADGCISLFDTTRSGFHVVLSGLVNLGDTVLATVPGLIAAFISVAPGASALVRIALAYNVTSQITFLRPAIASYDQAVQRFIMSLETPIKNLADMVDPGRPDPAFDPGNKWPDPTVPHESTAVFPYVFNDGYGQGITTQRPAPTRP